MAKKKKKTHIAHAAYADDNFSALEAHLQSGKVLKSPFSVIPGMKMSSWKDTFLPNMLWAAIVATSVDRDTYFALFRSIVGNVRLLDEPDKHFIAHTWLATMSPEQFNKVMAPLNSNPDVILALTSLRQITSLPDWSLWDDFLPADSQQEPFPVLAKAIAKCFFHQTEAATDIRWLKVMTVLVTGKFQLSTSFDERLKEFSEYPNYGDMRKVRPSIRAMEMSVRHIESGPDKAAHVLDIDAEKFWVECRSKTECVLDDAAPKLRRSVSELADELTAISIQLADHCDVVAPHTSVDARRDATFGLTHFAIATLVQAALSPIHLLSGGRMLLRSVVENVLVLKYLSAKDDPTIWEQYRSYGVGQAKLAFLKHVREEALPDYVTLEDLHNLANEDAWMEFVDVNLGAWDKLTLRGMAEFSGAKELYDKYYTWPSGFTHGQWAAVRETVFTTCLNPLHRFHRTLGPMKVMPSVLEDCCRLVNAMLDEVNKLYPSFSGRLKWHNKKNDE